jgi:hypothetical protein
MVYKRWISLGSCFLYKRFKINWLIMDEKTLNALVNAIKNKDPKGLKAYENL